MNSAEGQSTPVLGLADVLHAVESWPMERVLTLTRELAGSLPPEGRAAIARELLAPAPEASSATPAKKGDLSRLVGIIKYDGPPLTDEDLDALREERLREKYGPW